MKIMKLITVSMLMPLLVACSSTPLSQQLTADETAQLTPVYQMTLTGTKVNFTVNSHGCTMPEHFTLKQNKTSDGKVELALLRLKQDWCRAMPRAYPISFDLKAKTREQDLVLLNPIDKNKPTKFKVHSKNNNRK